MRFRDRFDRSKRTKSTHTQRIGVAFFWMIVVSYAFFIETAANFNTESHLYPAFALVDHHTLRIDAYQTRLGDRARYHGHFYTDKAPGLSFLAVAPYAVLRMAFPNKKAEGYIPTGKVYYSIPRTTTYLRYAITYFLVILPSAIFAVLLWLFLSRFVSPAWALAITGVYALGTIAFVYSTWYFSHQITAMLLFSAFLLLFAHLRGREPSRRLFGLTALAGALAGYSIISEY